MGKKQINIKINISRVVSDSIQDSYEEELGANDSKRLRNLDDEYSSLSLSQEASLLRSSGNGMFSSRSQPLSEETKGQFASSRSDSSEFIRDEFPSLGAN